MKLANISTMKKKQEWEKIASHSVWTEDLKSQIEKTPVQAEFKQGLLDHLESKGLLKEDKCNSFVLGVAFGEYANKTVDPKSDQSMRDFYVTAAVLANTKRVKPVMPEESK